jgi:hypothetical protein
MCELSSFRVLGVGVAGRVLLKETAGTDNGTACTMPHAMSRLVSRQRRSSLMSTYLSLACGVRPFIRGAIAVGWRVVVLGEDVLKA